MSKGFLYHIFSLPLPEIQHSSSRYQLPQGLNDFEKEPLIPYSANSLSNCRSEESLQELYENGKRGVYDTLCQSIKSEHRISDIRRIDLPQFKIGTLDSLIGISDELIALDAQYDSISNRFVNNLKSLLASHPTPSSFMPSSIDSYLVIGDKTLEQFICHFTWNSQKYRVDRSISEIVASLNAEVNAIDIAMKTKMSAFTNLKTTIGNFEKMNSGNLSVKNLCNVINLDIWKKDNLFGQSEYIETILVAVPINLVSEWENSYETLTDLVVPRSTNEIARDDEYVLYSVLVFHKMSNIFKAKAKESKYTVREFEYNSEQVAAERKHQEQLIGQLKEQWMHLIRLIKTNFAEVFSAWIHLKLIRVFVECVLRYGLPPIYMTMLVKSHKVTDKKIPGILLDNILKLDLPGISRFPKVSSLMSNAGGGGGGSHSTSTTSPSSASHLDVSLVAEGLEKEYLPFVLVDIKWTA